MEQDLEYRDVRVIIELVRQIKTKTDNGLWGLPGGSMELGEEIKEVARRELVEDNNKIFK